MNQTILFIDGENFLHKVKEVLIERKINLNKIDLSKFDFNFLLSKSLENYKISRKIFYAAKLHYHQETKDKSIKLILFQRYLKTNLEKQGFEFLIAGNVRSQRVGNKVIFREKGVDVKIAVDLVSLQARFTQIIAVFSAKVYSTPGVGFLLMRNCQLVDNDFPEVAIIARCGFFLATV